MSTATMPTAPTPTDPAIATADVPTVRRPFRLQWEEAQQAWVLLYPEGMIKLNRSAGEILHLCDGQRTVAQITAELQALFNHPDLSPDVLAFMAMARQQRWLAILPTTPAA